MSKKPKNRNKARRKRVANAKQGASDIRSPKSFSVQRDALKVHFTKFRPDEAYVALLISELWLPNISAQVKHCFAAATFVSIPRDRFESSQRIENYEDFRKFIAEVYRQLPSFPMLEDYIPDCDWGEIRIAFDAGIHPTLYGGSVERISDFVEAFRMKQASESCAIRDLNAALLTQAQIIRNVDQKEPRPAVGAIGSLHIPSKEFWAQFRQAIPVLLQAAAATAVSDEFVVYLGANLGPKSEREFGDAFMDGTALPHMFLEIDGDRYPVAPRELATVVIQHWEQESTKTHEEEEAMVSASLASFVRARLRHAFTGPYRIALRDTSLGYVEVPAILTFEATIVIIVAVHPDRLSNFQGIEAGLFAAFERDDGVLALDIEKHQLAMFRPKSAEPFDVRQVRLVAVATDASPAPKVIQSPGSIAHKLFLPDLVSIIESVTDIGELIAYFQFVEQYEKLGLSPFASAVDIFAAFKQSHAMLVDGAVQPTHIFLDPHWGSNWRYEQLKEFWASAPHAFPDGSPTAWRIKSSQASRTLICLIARGEPRMAWIANFPASSLAFMLELQPQNLAVEDGRLLELFIHCMADSAIQRQNLLPDEMFSRQRFVTYCVANEKTLPSKFGQDEVSADYPLLSNWTEVTNDASGISVRLEVDLAQVACGTRNATDGRFEADALASWVAGMSQLLGNPLSIDCVQQIQDSGNRKPRFITSSRPRDVDVPDGADPLLPTPEHYKLARRDLAVVFKNLGVNVGRYELAKAKALIDPARDMYRDLVHEAMARFAKTPLVLFAIEQFDEIIADYDATVHRIRMSLDHEVDFDRQRDLAKAHAEFVTNARNYRYLLECCLSLPKAGDVVPDSTEIRKLVAKIDWLMVLYQASDSLHNETAAAGITLDSNYVPEVFYSHSKDESYDLELADERLGINVSADDQTSPMDEIEIAQLNNAMAIDAGFSLRDLLCTTAVLARWPSVNDRMDDLQFSYRASSTEIVAAVIKAFPDTTFETVEKAVTFLTLDADRIRVLSGRSQPESDVPVWEHRKRDNRYAIRPLIGLDRELAWGPSAASRARDVWAGTVADGYLPADLPWPHVSEVTTSIKQRIELQLEERAFAICQRYSKHVLHGVNFKSRFPSESFEDVGDFDVLAYWPERNLWLAVECKYNKPPFAIKDARRLREHIFGKSEPGGHIEKIVNRRAFLSNNLGRLRTLLGWPDPAIQLASFVDAYVCPRIFYWMRDPPYPVQNEFVRLDMLDSWIQGKLLV